MFYIFCQNNFRFFKFRFHLKDLVVYLQKKKIYIYIYIYMSITSDEQNKNCVNEKKHVWINYSLPKFHVFSDEMNDEMS